MLLMRYYTFSKNEKWFWYVPEMSPFLHIWDGRYFDKGLNLDDISLEAYLIRKNTFSYSTNQV